ncbi:MAG: hypothetical protein AAFQ82_11225, partial [Myxococcota bacterium]
LKGQLGRTGDASCTLAGNTLTVKDLNGTPKAATPFRVPSGVDVHLIDDRFLVLINTQGAYSSSCPLGLMDMASAADVGPDPVVIIEPALYGERVAYNYEIIAGKSSTSSGFNDLQGFIDSFAHDLYKSEFDKERSELSLPGGPLTVAGPNRDGNYQIASRSTELTLTPEGQVIPGPGWVQHQTERKPTVTNVDLQAGHIDIHEPFKDGDMTFRVELNFGNSDPKDSYRVWVLENNTGREHPNPMWSSRDS